MKLTGKILIISFYFPPFPRVGGRRWAKYLKYLTKQGVDFKVLAGYFKEFEKENIKNDDIVTYKKDISWIKAKIKYPLFKRKLPIGVFEKIVWKLSYFFWLFLGKQIKRNFWDDSYGYADKFYSSAKRIIKEDGIKCLVITIGPFIYSECLIELRKDFPQLKIIVDIRDYWNDPHLNRNNPHEIMAEKNVLSSADKIFVVNEEMKKYFSINFKKPIFVLPHCLDFDDYAVLDKATSQKKYVLVVDKIQFIYGGTLYPEMEEEVNTFLACLKKMESHTDTFIYTNEQAYTKHFKSFSNNNIEILNPLSQERYFLELNKSDFILVFRPHWTPNAFSTKFYELLYFRKPILYFGPKGDVSDFIINNRLGFHVTLEWLSGFEIGQDLIKAISPDLINTKFDLSKYTFEYWTKELVKELQNI